MKLVDIPVVFICPDHNENYSARKHHMLELLGKIGFKTITHFKSGTYSYPNCLVDALIDILSKETDDSPMIILEDDVESYLELNSETEVEIPEDADAFYLGFCGGAGSKIHNWDEGSSVIDVISDKYIRILNMLGGHAILYRTKRYKEKVVEKLRDSVGKQHHSDVIFSRLHSEYNVYGYHYPFFYQSKTWGGAEIATNFRYHVLDRMLTINLCGGLGNQLFQLAFLLYASKLSGRDFFINTLKSPSTVHSSTQYYETLLKFWKPKFAEISKCITLSENSQVNDQDWNGMIDGANNRNVCFSGYFQRWKYVEPIRNEFISMLNFDESVLAKYPDISKKFFVHIRGGDYVNHYFHDVGLRNYYAKCLELCKGEEFVIFTNDVPYAENIVPGHEIIQESEVDTLLLMSKCKGCICANSSFSWWGAYLNPGRPTYFPNKWFNDPNMEISGYYFDGCQIVDLN